MFKNIIKVLFGNAFAQIIVLGTLPFVTRLYNPELFGIYGSVLSISIILSSISTLRLEYGILASDKNLIGSILSTALAFLSLFSLLLFIIFKVIHYSYQEINGFSSEKLMVVILMMMSFSFYILFSSVINKHENYKCLALSKVLQAAVMVTLQISLYYFFGADVNNLIYAYTISFLLSSVYVVYHAKIIELIRFNKKSLYFCFYKCKKIIIYQTPASFINAISQNVFILIMLALYGPVISGLYALANRMLLAPCALIGKSTRDVFIVEAARLSSERSTLKKLYRKTVFTLIKISLPVFLAVAIFSPYLFGFVFGDEWQASGYIMSALSLWGIGLFCNAPANALVNIIDIQKSALLYEITYITSRILIVFLMYFSSVGYLGATIAFSLLGLLFNIGYIYYVYKKI
ncbi:MULTISPECIES: oligosaccharide flippase family protein [Vibrio]|uniref:Polysaccharide biosynthesis protein n=1 Tax=Vibrio parahaemolyticus TaxID=670 RepID=A0A7M1VM31_VIBPH|nr:MULTISPECIES: oligosaccharide flippase family protein [Vibrio]EJL3948742.1 oligosaccharide flippase family protein [Vibrio parahaemolyticus]ELA7192417.1 oligosaccharide flippase family protein [Vibrio parahaemolyticus]MDW1600034.1 oligosaccharide flippase family protein [Vibrio sp. Vb2960]QOS16200.1 hypothetical protein VP356_00026 [Vibrio parahaemolyticus]HCE1776218.1 oligosaccharide flippase family protein [Vibrio parahaemolyticus]